MSGLRDIQLIEDGSGERTRAHHVVGVDESGNPTGSQPFVLVAVQCPRSSGELLAERLVQSDLDPWKSKSQTLSVSIDEAEQTQRIEAFLDVLDEIPITWSAVAGWDKYDTARRAAAACIVTTKALTASYSDRTPSYEGSAVLLHDGGEDTYGTEQRLLRKHAASQFGGGFDSVCPVYTSALPKADLTYPEVNAADYLAGYIRHEMAQGTAVEVLPDPVTRIDDSWRVADVAPVAHYRLRITGGVQQSTARSRIIAWIEGRRVTTAGSITGQKPYDSIVNRLTSDTLKQYLLKMDLG